MIFFKVQNQEQFDDMMRIASNEYHIENENFAHCLNRQFGAEILTCRFNNIKYAVIDNDNNIYDTNTNEPFKYNKHIKRCGIGELSHLDNPYFTKEVNATVSEWACYLFPFTNLLHRDIGVLEGHERIIRYIERKRKYNQPFFIKGLYKSNFTPKVVDFKECDILFNKEEGFHGCQMGIFSYFNMPYTVIVSDVMNIEKEYRAFVVGGRVINISTYKDYVVDVIPKNIDLFVRKAVQFIRESIGFTDSYVLDVCEHDGGVCSIVELNPIEFSGRYIGNEPFHILKALSSQIV